MSETSLRRFLLSRGWKRWGSWWYRLLPGCNRLIPGQPLYGPSRAFEIERVMVFDGGQAEPEAYRDEGGKICRQRRPLFERREPEMPPPAFPPGGPPRLFDPDA
jgi:hypothetical protein